jgi:hypothetical protein
VKRAKGKRRFLAGIIDSEMPTATYCLKGHYVGVVNPPRHLSMSPGRLRMMTEQAEYEDDAHHAFCTTCGAATISACQHCETEIEVSLGRPGYCGGCGKSFPWTEIALSVAKEYADELDELSPEEKTALKETFDDLTTDTNRTPLAVSRFKKVMNKIGPGAAAVFNKIIETIATEATKRMLGL